MPLVSKEHFMPALSTAAREDAIREHAYYLWERDGKPHGRDVEFWERAAGELASLTQRTRSAGRTAKPKTADAKIAAPKTKSGPARLRTSSPKSKPEAKA
jgi:hypothetical protein